VDRLFLALSKEVGNRSNFQNMDDVQELGNFDTLYPISFESKALAPVTKSIFRVVFNQT
jgi:hypothetical protein